MSGLHDLHVLIVEDEPFVRSTIKATLRAIGRFVVAEAEDGVAALGQLGTAKTDVVLCDMNMARMNGLDFVEMLRKHPDPVLRDTPVIMVTGRTDELAVHNARRLKISGYLVKPISPKLLGDRLRTIFPER